MTSYTKKLIAVFLSISILLTICVPLIATAQTGTLGTESPSIYTTFSSTDEENVDGNKLAAGTYDVTFHLSGMSNVSILSFSGTYDSSVITVNSNEPLLSDTYADISIAGGMSFSDSKFYIAFVSDNADTSAVDAQDTLIVKLNITVTTDSTVDFESVFVPDTYPEITFIEADYNDSEKDCYALVDSYEGYSGTLYPMTADLSPAVASSTFAVTGTAYQMISMAGDMGAVASGLTVTIGDQSTTTASDGTFSVANLTAGTYSMVISGASTIDRTISITITDSDVSLGDVAILCCDYAKDGSINAKDASVFMTTVSSTSSDDNYVVFADFNGDSSVNSKDAGIFNSFFSQTMTDIYSTID